MKILIDARMYGLEYSGIGRYLIKLIENLKKIDKTNNYVILLRKKYFNELNLNKRWKKVLADFRHYTLKEQIKLPGIINSEKPDLVHFPHLNIPYFWNGKFVVTIHDLTMHFQGRSASKLPVLIYYLKRIPFLLIARKAVKDSVKILVPSKAVCKMLIDYYNLDKSKIEVIYEGVDFGFFSSKDNFSKKVLSKFSLTKQKYFLYAGNLFPHKNILGAIQAIAEVNKMSNLGILLVIVGKDSLFNQDVIEFVEKNNLEKYVKFLGFVDDWELKSLYKNSIGFVYPSLSEGFGLQGLEAIASGTLVLASDIDVFREIYKNYAFYFDPKSIESIGKAMIKVVNMTEIERSRFLLKSQDFIVRYSWSKMANQVLNIYEQLFSKK